MMPYGVIGQLPQWRHMASLIGNGLSEFELGRLHCNNFVALTEEQSSALAQLWW